MTEKGYKNGIFVIENSDINSCSPDVNRQPFTQQFCVSLGDLVFIDTEQLSRLITGAV